MLLKLLTADNYLRDVNTGQLSAFSLNTPLPTNIAFSQSS